MDHTVRLAAFSELTHQTKEVVRNRQKLEQTPWDETAFKGEGQRRYNGLNALQIIIRAPRFLTFSGRGSGARRLEMGVMPPVSALVRYGVFDAFPVARGVSYRTT